MPVDWEPEQTIAAVAAAAAWKQVQSQCLTVTALHAATAAAVLIHGRHRVHLQVDTHSSTSDPLCPE